MIQSRAYLYKVLSLNNGRFGDFLDRIDHNELEMKDTTNSLLSACFILYLYLEIEDEDRSSLKL